MSDQTPDLSALLAETNANQRIEIAHITAQRDDARLENAGLRERIAELEASRKKLRDEITRLQECERLFTRCNEQRQEFLMRAYAAEDEITRLRSLIARTVVVMDGSWDMLPPHEQDRLAEELRDAALTDAPAPPRTD